MQILTKTKNTCVPVTSIFKNGAPPPLSQGISPDYSVKLKIPLMVSKWLILNSTGHRVVWDSRIL